jgi:hypothetical protein
MTKTLIRSVYLDGVHLAPGTELTDEQAERITNPHATEDLAIEGQDGKSAEGDDAAPPADRGMGDGEPQARKAATANTRAARQ